MRQVLCFGEALIDFLNFNDVDDDLLSLKEYRQYPGGAPANAAVAVAKLNGNALFAGQVGQDNFGDFLEESLKKYNVDTSLVRRHESANTALAFVMLDETGDRSFTFFRQNTADVLFPEIAIHAEWFEKDTILHFCSNTLTQSNIAKCTQTLVKKARNAEALVSFDVNLRHNLWAAGSADRDIVNQLVEISDLIKYSKDELEYLANGDSLSYIQNTLEAGVQLIIVTDGQNDVHIYSQQGNTVISPPIVEAIDTTAGGDAFIGAFLYGLSVADKIELADLSKISRLVTFATHCGGLAVTRPGAFPALPTFDEVEVHWHNNN